MPRAPPLLKDADDARAQCYSYLCHLSAVLIDDKDST